MRVKLRHLDELNRRRNQIVKSFKRGINKDIFEYQAIQQEVYSNYHIFAARVKNTKRDALIDFLKEEKIQTNIYYVLPLHLQKALKFLNLHRGDFTVAEKLCQEIIALPLYPEMSTRVQNKMIKAINKFKVQ